MPKRKRKPIDRICDRIAHQHHLDKRTHEMLGRLYPVVQKFEPRASDLTQWLVISDAVRECGGDKIADHIRFVIWWREAARTSRAERLAAA